ncbi:MAG: 2OG-Fe(II) oxygenase [Nitratireductor sp.]|nr:2OG-Fe(II) oxygenase [Nitratireductor sp.]
MLCPVTIHSVFSSAECEHIIALAQDEASGGFETARLVGGVLHGNIRRARISWLDEEKGAAWVLERIVKMVADVNRNQFDFVLEEFGERMQVAAYDGDAGGHFDWHSDIGDGVMAARRKLTVVVQLSPASSYDGGLLTTNHAGHEQDSTKEIGAAIVFPAFVLHRVSPVSCGIRHSLTTWVHGPAFR